MMKMRFNSLLSQIKGLNLPKGEYAIFGSGPMAIRGIREAEDIDIIATKRLWKELAKKYDADKNQRGTERIKIGDIEIYSDDEWMPKFEGIDKVIPDSETIEGYPFAKLKYVIEWKKKFGRDKDKKDIEIIGKYLSTGAA